MSRTRTRRRFLTATAAVLGGLGVAATNGADDHGRSFVLEQDGECRPVVPLSGEAPVEAFYDWGRDVRSWSAEGPRELQRSETSHLFLYRGPEGVSLVVIHDSLDDGTPGGAASFTLTGVPDDATWVVKDDLYDAESNVDTWRVNGTVLEANETEDGDIEAVPANGTADGNATAPGNESVAIDGRTDSVDWWWTDGRTDGGALRGLDVEDLELRIDAAFNEDAALFEDPDHGTVTTWALLSGDIDDPDRAELDPEEPAVLRTGSCGADEPSTPTRR